MVKTAGETVIKKTWNYNSIYFMNVTFYEIMKYLRIKKVLVNADVALLTTIWIFGTLISYKNKKT